MATTDSATERARRAPLRSLRLGIVSVLVFGFLFAGVPVPTPGPPSAGIPMQAVGPLLAGIPVRALGPLLRGVLAPSRVLGAEPGPEGGDPPVIEAIPGAPSPLALDECLDAALRSNASLAAERIREDELGAQMVQALSTGLPTLDVTGTWSRGRDPTFALDESFSSTGEEGGTADTLFAGFLPAPGAIPAQTFWRGSLNASWELRPGRVYNAIGAAGLGLERQELSFADAEHRKLEEVMVAYYEIARAGERLAALDAEVAAKQELLEISVRRYRVEFATPLDTLQAAVSLANLRPERRRAAQALRDAGSRLNILMGRPALTPVSVIADLEPELDEIDSDRATEVAAARPEVRTLELLEKILRKNRGAQKAEHRPYLSLGASYGLVGRDLASLTDPGHDFWSASVTLGIPVFDGMLTKGRVEETEAEIRRTERESEEARRQARLEVLTLLGDLAAARENLGATSLNLKLAELALDRVTQRYEAAKAAYLDVLNAQAERFTARTHLIDARYDVLRLTASLKRALGVSPRTPLSEIEEALSP